MPGRRTAVICFVKTPGLSPAKSRLAASIGERPALEVYLRLLGCVRETFRELADLGITPVWAVNEASAEALPLWKDHAVWIQPPGSLGEKLRSIDERAAESFDRWVFIGSDAPALGRETILQALSILEGKPLVAGPSLDGGFYLWGATEKLSPERWLRTPYSSGDTLENLTRGIEVPRLPVLPDLDEARDIPEVLRSLAGPKTPAREHLEELLEKLRSLSLFQVLRHE